MKASWSLILPAELEFNFACHGAGVQYRLLSWSSILPAIKRFV
jgi:hypothetical protein